MTVMYSPRWSLSKDEGKQIRKVAIYTVLSAACSIGISLLPMIDVPPEQRVFIAGTLFPIINTLLVALRKFASEHGSLLN